MAGRTPTDAPEKSGPKTHKYVVLSDAVVVTIGKKSNGKAEYTRILRGGVINGVEGSETIADLLRKGAIMRATSPAHLAEVQADLVDPARSRFRQTVRKASKAMGAEDDPVQAPQPEVLPVRAPAAGVDGNNLTLEDVASE